MFTAKVKKILPAKALINYKINYQNITKHISFSGNKRSFNTLLNFPSQVKRYTANVSIYMYVCKYKQNE